MAAFAHDFDLFVIGGGSGGVRAARVAANLGKRVAIAEEYRFGGTCVIRGCVPKKLLVYASRFRDAFEDAQGFGWSVGAATFDWRTLMAAKNREIARLEGLYRKGVENAGATVFSERAEIAGPNSVRLVGSGKTATAAKILVATGGRPNPMAELPGHELCITSNDAFELAALPRSIVIHGGGYVAVEFAGIFAGLGSRVTLVARGPRLLRGFDTDLADLLAEAMRARGVDVIMDTRIEQVSATAGGGRRIGLSGGRTIEAEQVMLATGRLANTRGLGLEGAGVRVAANGAIAVDAWSRSSVPDILAIGDVTDRIALTPVAIHEAMCLVETEFKGNPTSPDHELVPTAVFSQPEIGSVGLSEAEAARRHSRVDVYKALFRPMKHTLTGRDERTMMKIVTDGANGRVLGVHLFGPDSAEIVQSVAIAVKMGATKADFDRTMALHPTAAEELVTMYQPSYRVIDGRRA
jgi:glutathione reductase (NADPH)